MSDVRITFLELPMKRAVDSQEAAGKACRAPVELDEDEECSQSFTIEPKRRKSDDSKYFCRLLNQEMACNQTAVAVLQELCMKRRWSPPIYETTDQSGTPNDPMFEVSVTLHNGVVGVGRGRQKKAAKHDAAQKALAQLQGKALPDITDSPVETVAPSSAPINPCEDIGGSNPVGDLQMLCASKHFPPPVYTLIGDVGEPHEKTFTYKCTVSERSASGQARKKQLAKHYAAQNMLQVLKSTMKSILDEIPNDPAVSSMYSQKVKEVPVVAEDLLKRDLEVAEQYKVLRSKDDIPSAPVISPGTKFADYHRAYASQLSEYKDIKNKPKIKQEVDYLKKLQMIADELHFTIFQTTTTDTTRVSPSYIVFIHLDTDPPTIQAGYHRDEKTATQEAARNVIEFFDIMTT